MSPPRSNGGSPCGQCRVAVKIREINGYRQFARGDLSISYALVFASQHWISRPPEGLSWRPLARATNHLGK